ncbi:transposase family protein, partial [Streptomyces sp. NPDC054794]
LPRAPRQRPRTTQHHQHDDRLIGYTITRDTIYIGASPWVTTPLRRPPGGDLTPTQRTVNRALSAARAPVERGVARLKSWRIFRKARCSPNRMSSISAAVLTLERHR